MDTPWAELPARMKSKPARVPRFVAEWVEGELIRIYSNKFIDSCPFITAGKVELVNISKNYSPKEAILLD